MVYVSDVERGNRKPFGVVGGLVSGLARGGVTDEQLENIKTILKERTDHNE